MALLSLLKTKLLAILAGAVAVLMFIVAILNASRKKAKKQVKQFKAVLKRKEDIEESDTELSEDLASRKAKISKEIKDGEEITVLSDPNNWD